MANPTTNYGFVMPTSTDLVTDLPADFDIFGQAVDTQMLTNANAAIAKSIVDAKGDIIAATAADTVSRLAVGTNGHVLTADSTAATGIKWAAPAGGGKVLQVVNTTYSTEVASTTNTFVDTGLTATITPSSATSKILVIVSQMGVSKSGSTRMHLKLLRGATDILQMSDINAYTGASDFNNIGSVTSSYLDSPATTSATTYKTQFCSNQNVSVVYVQNYSTTAGNSVSTITLMEIGA
jgi:hypothetical protein